MGTAIISDRYDNYNYMTKAYVCIFCTFVSIPACCMIYLCTTSFPFSMFGLVVEYTLSTGWGQPAIGILSTVCDPAVRGTAVSMFFFLTTIFGVIAPNAFHAIQNYYGLDPTHEKEEFGRMICAFTVIPCIFAIPCFYIAGVKYSWYKYHEAMFMLDVWGEMEQWYQDDISKKRFMQMQMNPDAGDPANLSVSVDWKLIKDQRKMKLKHFKKEAIDFQRIKPTLKARKSTLGGFLQKKKSLVANLKEDETPSEFPDTRSIADNENFEFDKYAQSYDGRKVLDEE